MQGKNLNKLIPQTFGYVLRLYLCHPEAKSLAPDGTTCGADTLVCSNVHQFLPESCGMSEKKPIGAGAKAKTQAY